MSVVGWTNIAALCTADPTSGEGPLGILRDAAVVAVDGRIAWVGPASEFPDVDISFDMAGAAVLPGFVDAHMHPVFAGEELLTIMTTSGSSALGLPDAGLVVGGPADFIEVDTSSARMAGHDRDALTDALVYAAAPGDVRTVGVAGVERVSGGAHVQLDTAAELDRVIRQVVGA